MTKKKLMVALAMGVISIIAFLLIFDVIKPEGIYNYLTNAVLQRSGYVKDSEKGSYYLAEALYNEYDNDDDNVFFSPVGIFSALTMTYEGARGDTASQMQEALFIPADDDSRQLHYKQFYDRINQKEKSYDLSIANALWVQEDYPIKKSYVDEVKDYYGAEAVNLDFETATESSRLQINNWVEKKTQDRIKDLIKPGLISYDTKLVITNAIYFKADWKLRFEEEGTREEEFTIGTGRTKKVDMMSIFGESFMYHEDDLGQLIKLEYEGEDVEMMIYLPQDNDQEVDLSSIFDREKNLKEQKVNVYLPSFRFEKEYEMKPTLKKLGMVDAFDDLAADFSGITGDRDLYISNVIHKAFVDVNEEGTEATAATAVISRPTAMLDTKPLPIFRADRPFIFFIKEKESDTILFMGKVNDPTK